VKVTLLALYLAKTNGFFDPRTGLEGRKSPSAICRAGCIGKLLHGAWQRIDFFIDRSSLL
jgi:hypothetical protein